MNAHMPKPIFRKIVDIDSETAWISQKCNNEEFEYFLVMRLTYLQEHGEDIVKDFGKYIIEIHVVSLTGAKNEEKNVSESFDPHDWNAFSDEIKAYEYVSYGISARLFATNGNNKKELIRAAKKESNTIQMLFGVYMDRPINSYGNTGWDFIKGKIG